MATVKVVARLVRERRLAHDGIVRGVVCLGALATVALLAGGCSGGSDTTAPAGEPGSSAKTQPAKPAPPRVRCTAGSVRSFEERGIAVVLQRPATAYRSPEGAAVATFGLRNANGVRTTFRVLDGKVDGDCAVAWYRVQLPIRPNGSQGWIRADAVRAYSVEFRILVDLSERRLSVFDGNELIVRVPTAVGRPETPTPTGSYYVNQRLLAADPTGPWGPGGIGISAFSPVLADWAQGGPIAIHGTNEPWSIGQAASHGCLRIANDVLARLIRLLPDGTPVRIRS